MLRFLKGFFGKPIPPDVTPTPEPVAPYKVEAPVAPAVEIVPIEPTSVAKPEPKKAPVKKAPVKKAPVVKTAVAAKKPRTRKTPAK